MSWFGGAGEEQADRGSSEREELLGRQHGRRLPSRCPQSRPCGGQWGQDSNSDSWKSELPRPALFVLQGVGSQPCAPRLAFPFLTSFSGSLNCCRGGQGNQVGSCSGISHRPGSTGTMPFVLSLGTPGSSGQQLWPAVIPGHRGFLSSACPHEPCDRELATCPPPHTGGQLGICTSQPSEGESRNATCWLWAGDLGSCSFKWAEKSPCLPARGHCQENTFLPVGLVWTSSGAPRSGGWGLSHFTLKMSLFPAVPHVVTEFHGDNVSGSPTEVLFLLLCHKCSKWDAETERTPWVS